MLDLGGLKRALDSMEKLAEKMSDKDFMGTLDGITRKGLRSGMIQNFEFTYELCWKMMKRWIEGNIGRVYIEGVSRRELFRFARESLLIDNIEKWMNYHEARNITSHTYNEEMADEVFRIAMDFIIEAQKLYSAIEAKND
ncbi:MAG: nucleotidyltransferase [Brevinematales bacterium]|nr:nucleotidyltransferase [Brevinematales bacterium]